MARYSMDNRERWLCFILGALFAAALAGLFLALEMRRDFEALVCVLLAALFLLAAMIIGEDAEYIGADGVQPAKPWPRGGYQPTCDNLKAPPKSR